MAEPEIKVPPPNADIGPMISVSCQSCGSDLEDPRDAVCMHCGLPVGGRPKPDPAGPSQPPAVDEPPVDEEGQRRASAPSLVSPLSTESAWKLGLWGALLVSIVAVGGIAATLLSAATRSPDLEGPPATPTTESTAIGDVDLGPAPPTPDFDPPLAGSITIDHPDLNVLTRRHLDDAVVTFQLGGDFCGSRGGSITANGEITNYSMARQRFDYTITVDLIRAWNRSTIGTLETTIEGLAPLESAEWSVEMISSRVSSIDCNVTSITATPSG